MMKLMRCLDLVKAQIIMKNQILIIIIQIIKISTMIYLMYFLEIQTTKIK